MAFVSSCRKQGTWTGVGAGGVNTYTVEYDVETDDQADGPKVVLDGMGLTINQTTYKEGNDTDTRSTLLSMTPRRSGPTRWVVTCEYGDVSQKDDQKPDDNGDYTDDPTLWRDEYKATSGFIQRPLRSAWNVDAINFGNGESRLADTAGPIQLSNGLSPNPPPMVDVPTLTWQIRQYTLGFDESVITVQYFNKLNNADTQLSVPAYGATVHAPGTYIKHSVWFSGLDATLTRVNDVDLWVLNWEFTYNPELWYELIPDQSLMGTAADGQPDQDGGTYSPGNDVAGRDNYRHNIFDRKGDLIQEATNLKDGVPLQDNDPPPAPLRYRTKDDMDYNLFQSYGIIWTNQP